MNQLPARDERGKPDAGVYENNGFFYGTLVGVLVGVLITGPHFTQWSLLFIVSTILACSMLAGLVGYMLVSSSFAALSAGTGTDTSEYRQSLPDDDVAGWDGD